MPKKRKKLRIAGTFKGRVLSVLLSLLCMLGIFPESALAGSIDPSHRATLTISYTQDGSPMEGAPFKLYKVGDVDETGTVFTLSGDFSQYSVKVNGLDSDGWKAAAETLSGYVSRDNLTPIDSGSTGTDGTIQFPNQAESLTAGLYLAIGDQFVQGDYVYTTEPFLVVLPNYEAGKVDYNVTANAKHSREKKPDDLDETVTRRVLKIWSGDDASVRPTKVTVSLLRDGTVYSTFTLRESNNWSTTWTGLPKYNADGTTVNWQVAETVPTGYTVQVGQTGITFTIKNTYKEQVDETTERTVKKVWAGDVGHTRPVSVTIQLLKDGAVYSTVVLNSDNDWQYNWSKLPKYNSDGTEIKWTVKENTLANYTAEITQSGTTFTVTNTYKEEEETVTRTVKKVWKGDSSAATARPTSVSVDLLKDGQVYQTVTLSSANSWQYSWDKLPKNNADGSEIKWTVSEKALDNYTAAITESGTTFTITNTYTKPSEETVTRTVKKVWKNDTASVRPTSVSVQLLKDGTVYQTVTLSAANSWQYSWDKLPKKNSDGTEIKWTVSEKSVDNYTAEVTQSGTVFTVTNTYKGSSDETVSRTVKKVWKNDSASKRPSSVTVQILKDGAVYETVTLNSANSWQYSWSKLPKYNSDGTQIKWTVSENSVENYTASITESGTVFTITNTYTEPSTETVTRTVKKVWKDDTTSVRPASVSIDLLKDGTIYQTVTLSSANSWQYTWNKLPKKNSDGTEIKWTVSERSVTNYTASITESGTTFTVTNTYKEPSTETVTRTVKKVWKNDTASVRPTSVTVELLKDGKVYYTVALNSANNWQYTWNKLPKKNSDGTTITWSINEQAVSNYTASIVESGTTFTVTNTYTKSTDETVKRTVKKVWKSDTTSVRPTSVTVDLLKDGQVYYSVVLNSTNNWQYTWDKLPKKNSDGTTIAWTISERSVTGYTASISESGTTFTITNTYKESSTETVKRTVKKVWKNDTTSVRPKSVTVELLKDGNVYYTVTLNSSNNWSYSWDKLPKYNTNGSEIVWTVNERAVTNYTSSISESGTTFTITNTYGNTSQTVSRTVKKVWKNDTTSVRPKSISVELLKDGTVYKTVTLNSSNSWTYTWEKLSKYNSNGSEIEWTVNEKSVENYTASISTSGTTFTITNTYSEPSSGTITRTVRKVWKGDSSDVRPKSISVSLLKNGTAYNTVTLNAANSWQYSWSNLPKTDTSGKTITWSVSEETLKDYTASVTESGNTFTITNTYNGSVTPSEPSGPSGDDSSTTVSRSVTKVWDDSGYESKRPSKITVTLYKNGSVYDTRTLTASDNWSFTWSSLPKSENGKEITWSIAEDSISGYKTSIKTNGSTFTITNSISTSSKLPQTGQTWWPVPLLAIAGVVFVILGAVNGKKHKEHDEK